MDKKAFAKNEFIGENVCITKCKDPKLNGKTGKIIDETKNTFVIKTEDGKEKRIAKEIASFEFMINNEKIMIEGSKICYRPEDRIKKC